MSQEIRDFTDLAKGVEFKFKGEKYVVPAYSDPENMALIRKSHEIQEALGDTPRPETEAEERERIRPEDVDRMERFFAAENAFIATGIRLVKEDGSFDSVSEETVKSWPRVVKAKITKLINENMNFAEEEDVNPT